jgi:hypothetical protein
MLNPALLAVVTAAAAIQYELADEKPMPWPLAFLVAPLVLHRGTREVLPKTTRSHLGTWVAQHPVEHAGFALRAVSLRDSVREGIRFGVGNGLLAVDTEGRLMGTLATGKGRSPDRASEAGRIVAQAGFVGKWFTKIDQPATAFVMLGVAP